MKKYSTFLILSSLLFLTWTAFTPSKTTTFEDETWEEKISPKLMTQALRGEALDFLVVLKNQKNVNAAQNFKTKEARGNFVYEKLKQNAQADQKNILKVLKNAQASYRPFFIINAIQVKGDFNLLQKLAKLPEVKQLTDNSPIQFEEPVATNYSNSRGPTTIEWGIDMIDAEEGFTFNNKKYPGVKRIITDLQWAIKNDIWNISRIAYNFNGIINIRHDS